MPHHSEFHGYEAVLPGAADRIVTMAEKAQQARIDVDVIPIKAEARALIVATIGVTFLPWLLILSAVALALSGRETAAWVAGAVGLLGSGAQIIQATRRPRQHRG